MPMTNEHSRRKITQRLMLLVINLLLLSSPAFASGVCDLPGGSGIGGTGSPLVTNGSGIGGTGYPIANNGSGIGGTGKPLQNGIGGTGKPLQNGIGGTGKSVAKSGVVTGTITGFGSICVNGIEIHYAKTTPLLQDGKQISANNLAVGQVVTANISGVGNEVTAKAIHVVHAATGPISAINLQSGTIEVLGQQVILPDNFNDLRIGNFVQVSGLRRFDGRIVATRVHKIPPQNQVSLLGHVTAVAKNNFQVQGMKINGTAPAHLKPGDSVLVSGKLHANAIIADSIKPESVLQGKPDIGGMVSLESYFNGKQLHGNDMLSGNRLSIPKQIRREIDQAPRNSRVIFTGILERDNEIHIEQVHIEHPFEQGNIQSHSESSHREHHSHNKDNEREVHSHTVEQSSHQIEHHNKSTIGENAFHGKSEHSVQEVHDFISHDTHSSIYETDENERLDRPEVHEHERPQFREFEAPEVHYEKPEFEAPEVHYEKPEFEVPEVHYEKPEVPELPEVHYEQPEVPELPEVHYEKPEIPEVHYEKPELPEYESH